ncbi:hypothetical protein [Sphingobacterium bambusae]|uniref:hypothetical protein n=1 Tax=Sphingobacterium bambusae TaxID=662858 RepID=UPI0036D2F5B3
MRLLSFTLYYLSFLLGAYAVIFAVIKFWEFRADVFPQIKYELFFFAIAMFLLFLSKVMKPKVRQDQDGRTITKKL